MLDYDLQRCTRHCAATGRDLAEGETIYVVLKAEGAQLRRYDYAAESWSGPPADCLGWWKTQVPSKEGRGPQLAPSDVMLTMLRNLADEPDKQALRYVLALLLVRRRILRVEESEASAAEPAELRLFCPRDESSYTVAVVFPDEAQAAQIQQELSQVLFVKPPETPSQPQ